MRWASMLAALTLISGCASTPRPATIVTTIPADPSPLKQPTIWPPECFIDAPAREPRPKITVRIAPQTDAEKLAVAVLALNNAEQWIAGLEGALAELTKDHGACVSAHRADADK